MKSIVFAAGLLISSIAWCQPLANISFVYGERISEFKIGGSEKNIHIEFQNNAGKTGKRDFSSNDARYVRDTLEKFKKNLPSESGPCMRKEITLKLLGPKVLTKRVCFDVPTGPTIELVRFVDLLSTYF